MCNSTKKKKFSNFFRRVGEKTRKAIWKPVQAAGGADTPPVPPAAAAAGKITAEAPRRENRRGGFCYQRVLQRERGTHSTQRPTMRSRRQRRPTVRKALSPSCRSTTRWVSVWPSHSRERFRVVEPFSVVSTSVDTPCSIRVFMS